MTDDLDRLIEEAIERGTPTTEQKMAVIRRRIEAKSKVSTKAQKSKAAERQLRSKILPQEGVVVSREDAETLNKILGRIGKRGRAAVLSQAGILANAAKYLGSLGGRKGGSRGGKARMEALTAEQRSELGRKAAAARWKGAQKK
jgi:Mg-chelatase subunit ChlI